MVNNGDKTQDGKLASTNGRHHKGRTWRRGLCHPPDLSVVNSKLSDICLDHEGGANIKNKIKNSTACGTDRVATTAMLRRALSRSLGIMAATRSMPLFRTKSFVGMPASTRRQSPAWTWPSAHFVSNVEAAEDPSVTKDLLVSKHFATFIVNAAPRKKKRSEADATPASKAETAPHALSRLERIAAQSNATIMVGKSSAEIARVISITGNQEAVSNAERALEKLQETRAVASTMYVVLIRTNVATVLHQLQQWQRPLPLLLFFYVRTSCACST